MYERKVETLASLRFFAAKDANLSDHGEDGRHAGRCLKTERWNGGLEPSAQLLARRELSIFNSLESF